MKFAYADPPYVGYARRYEEKMEVDHADLIERLGSFDGWALSASSPSLKILLPMCPEDVRVGAWVKPFCSWNTNPAYAWEPVIFRGGRKKPKFPVVRDWISVVAPIKKGMVGTKPEMFCYWMFEILGAQRGDEFVDVFPGSGAVTRAWETWSAQLKMF